MRELRAPVAGHKLVEVHVCNQEGCPNLAFGDDYCSRCREEIEVYAELDEGSQRRPMESTRSGWLSQFFGVLMLMLMGEGIWNYAIGLPINLRTFGISLGWALVVALTASLLHARKKVEGSHGRK